MDYNQTLDISLGQAKRLNKLITFTLFQGHRIFLQKKRKKKETVLEQADGFSPNMYGYIIMLGQKAYWVLATLAPFSRSLEPFPENIDFLNLWMGFHQTCIGISLGYNPK